MDEKEKRNSAKTRQTTCYPPQKYHILLEGYNAIKGTTKSEALVDIIKEKMDSLPENERERCLKKGIQIVNDKQSKHAY